MKRPAENWLNEFSKKVLVALFVVLLVFVGLMIWLFYRYQSVPDTLIISFFALFTGEIGVLGLIKVKKDKNQ